MTTKYSDQQDNDFNNAIQLDSEFDQHLASMKKYILLLSDKQGLQHSISNLLKTNNFSLYF